MSPDGLMWCAIPTTAGQSAILGTLSPEHFLDVAAALLVQAAGPPPP